MSNNNYESGNVLILTVMNEMLCFRPTLTTAFFLRAATLTSSLTQNIYFVFEANFKTRMTAWLTLVMPVIFLSFLF